MASVAGFGPTEANNFTNQRRGPSPWVAALLTVLAPGKTAEVGMVGAEGLVGMSAAAGIKLSQLRAVVQGQGTALRMKAGRLEKEVAASGALQRSLFRFTQELMGQVTQVAACNRFHRAEMRMARWLLVTRDRLRANSFRMTHELLAQMIGARRVGVTNAAGNLAKRNLISYSRGNVRVLDVSGLRAASCECYEVAKGQYAATPVG